MDTTNIPEHIAIIMDGNGRWAKSQGKQRVFGHKKGTDSVHKVVEECARIGIKHLTLFAFSTENWSRPKKEVDALMLLLIRTLKSELKKLTKNNICLKSIGELSKLPEDVQKALSHTVEQTKKNDRMVLTLALNYGAKEEITRAAKEIATNVKKNIIDEKNINEEMINKHLYSQNLPDVDLLIRTSGEQRISNFLLWKIAYAELYFTQTYWPNFDEKELGMAISNYQKRERRFGKTSNQL